jgi:hypothetical protein
MRSAASRFANSNIPVLSNTLINERCTAMYFLPIRTANSVSAAHWRKQNGSVFNGFQGGTERQEGIQQLRKCFGMN